MGPGPAFNVLGEFEGKPVIEVSSAPQEKSVGSLDLLTVSSYGSPGNTPGLFDLVSALFSSDKVVLPLESVYPLNKSSDETEKELTKQFLDSEEEAVKAALNLIGPIEPEPKITFHLEEVGGPSGGLIFALGIIDKLTEGELTGGKSIAGSGTISADGKVGAIGGIRLKMLAAAKAGDRFFLAPKSNCEEVVGFIPSGLQVVPVSSLSEALEVLKVIASDGNLSVFPGCPVQ